MIRYVRRGTIVLLATITIVATETRAQQEESAGDEANFSIQSSSAVIPQKISFQGYLDDDGSPANGTYDFQLALFADLVGGVSIVTTTIGDQPVVNGAFDLEPAFGGTYFWEDARYMEVRVRDGASAGSYEVISPRSPILGVPLALALPNVFSNTSTGFVGIGRSNPIGAEAFGVQSTASTANSFGGMYMNTAASSTRPFYGYATANSIRAYHYLDGATGKWRLYNNLGIRMTVQSDGRVGIGTDSPGEMLHVDGADADILVGSASGRHILIEGESAIGSALRLYNAANVETITLDGEEASGQGSAIALYNSSGTKTIELDADFGAGNGNPGRVITDELELNGSDLAEHFDITAALDSGVPSAGMVVSIDADRPGELVVSSSPYDPTVIGIISGAGGVRPGIYMGQSGTIADGEFPVAVAGRVYVMADAKYGAITPGAMLTTSASPGHAMLASDTDRARGAIIGKAMTSLDEGQGLVLIFVSLQ